MRTIKNRLGSAVAANAVLLSILALSSAISGRVVHASENPDVESVLVQELAQVALRCAHQPFTLAKDGRKIYGALRSHCPELQVSEARSEIEAQGRLYAVVVKESDAADGADLNDVYVQFDAREDQEVLVQPHVLAFGDPVLAVLLAGGESPEKLPEVLDPSILH